MHRAAILFLVAAILVTAALSTSFITFPLLSGEATPTTKAVDSSPHEFPVCGTLSSEEVAVNRAAIASSPNGANYNEQLWLAFARNFTSIDYNVTAVAQNDSSGYGPSYFINGLADQGLWYQVGLSWNQAASGLSGYAAGFRLSYEVWNSATGESVFPSSGAAGSISFDDIRSGDTVSLSLHISNAAVTMRWFDWRAKAVVSQNIPAEGASYFVGFKNRVPDFPSSLLTEWQHSLPYFCTNKVVVFSNSKVPLVSAWMRIDEWNLTGSMSPQRFSHSDSSRVLFSTPYIHFQFGNLQFQSVKTNVTTLYANSNTFITM